MKRVGETHGAPALLSAPQKLGKLRARIERGDLRVDIDRHACLTSRNCALRDQNPCNVSRLEATTADCIDFLALRAGCNRDRKKKKRVFSDSLPLDFSTLGLHAWMHLCGAVFKKAP